MPRPPDVDTLLGVLMLVEDTIGGLVSLLLAAEIAAVQQARIHVTHVSAPRIRRGAAAGMAAPTPILAEADRAASGELQERADDVLALGPSVERTFTRTRDIVHDKVTRLVRELSPIPWWLARRAAAAFRAPVNGPAADRTP